MEKDADSQVTSPIRHVTIKLFSRLCGLTEKSIRNRIARGCWAEGIHYRRSGGRIFFDMEAFDKWVVGQKD
jgi:hypothetical protein